MAVGYSGIICAQRIKKAFFENITNIEIAITYAAGLIFGAAVNCRFGLQSIVDMHNVGFVSCFCNYLIINLIILSIVFILGLCLIGTPAILLILFIKAAGCSLLMTNLYVNYGLTGLRHSLIYILPYTFLLMLSLIFSAVEGLYCINDIKQSCAQNIYGKIRLSACIKKHIISLLLTVAASFLQAICFVCADGKIIHLTL